MTLKWSLWLSLTLCLSFGQGCSQTTPKPENQTSEQVKAPSSALPTVSLFTNVAQQAGIDFRFANGAKGRHYLIETTGSGCAFVDYNNDGLPDILLLQAGTLPPERKPTQEPQNRLYRNKGDGTFTDVTKGSGLEDTGYSQGVAIGDVDGDGYDDIFTTAYGGNHLFHNLKGTGKFQDITSKAGLSDTAKGPRWCTSAAFGDYNNDGKLDLYVCRYALWSPTLDKPCKNPKGESSYCSPELYAPEVHSLYKNNGDGTFTDVSEKTGITAVKGHGLAVAWLDYDGDGWEDIFVANDLSPYMLWHNNGNGAFTEIGQLSNIAYSEMGSLLSGMGIGVRDYNGDGREDVFVTNFSGQMNALYRNEASKVFTNMTTASGVGPASMKHLAFGCEFLDYDRDGLPDIIIGNGHVNDDVETYSQGDTYTQPKSLLKNNGYGTFTPIKEGLGDAAKPHVTRGLAVGDYDLDGNLDVLTNNQDGLPELLRFTGEQKGHWFAVDVRGVQSNPNGYHAKVTIKASGKRQFAEVRSGSSFASHSSSRLYFGVGDATTIEELNIVWHGTKTTIKVKDLKADQAYLAVEGKQIAPIAFKGRQVKP